MMTETIDRDLTVAELLSARPQTVPVFLSHRMACVGCNMAAFETLADAARIYGLVLDAWIDELKAVQERPGAGQIV